MKREPVILTEKISAFAENDRERILEALKLCGDGGASSACMLIDLGLDADVIIAALIIGRDDPDKTGTVHSTFGKVVADLVEGTEKIERLPVDNKTIREAQNIRDMIFALTDDIRVL
ncbi:MAG: HD domain-containing protein, partial [Treponema sp.]|nr:HD domain-containing protein [Treponema sp.]